MTGNRRLRCVMAVAAFGAVGAVGASPAAGALAAAPTVKDCAQLRLASFQGNQLAATVSCLRPSSMRTTASVTWTTCRTTPRTQPCEEGSITLTFRSTGSGSKDVLESWGRETAPGGWTHALSGTGRYRCEAHSVDRTNGTAAAAAYTKTIAVRDQAVGFAARGTVIVVATSVHPGRRGPLGADAGDRLRRQKACRVGIPTGVRFVRTLWPGTTFPAGAFAGTGTTVTSSGTVIRTLPVPRSQVLDPGVRIQATIRWSSTVVIVPALRRR